MAGTYVIRGGLGGLSLLLNADGVPCTQWSPLGATPEPASEPFYESVRARARVAAPRGKNGPSKKVAALLPKHRWRVAVSTIVVGSDDPDATAARTNCPVCDSSSCKKESCMRCDSAAVCETSLTHMCARCMDTVLCDVSRTVHALRAPARPPRRPRRPSDPQSVPSVSPLRPPPAAPASPAGRVLWDSSASEFSTPSPVRGPACPDLGAPPLPPLFAAGAHDPFPHGRGDWAAALDL
jgi:hypothetical protein